MGGIDLADAANRPGETEIYAIVAAERADGSTAVKIKRHGLRVTSIRPASR